MKKLIIMFLSVFLLTGCTAVRINTDKIDTIINVVLSKDNTLYNTIGKGYKYYKPRGVTYIDTNEFNEKLYSNGNYYYLYVDINSYYYKKEFEYKENNESFYSKYIDINDKYGYLEINEYKGKYLIEFMYNYAKIEAVVNKENINEVVLNASYILSTILKTPSSFLTFKLTSSTTRSTFETVLINLTTKIIKTTTSIINNPYNITGNISFNASIYSPSFFSYISSIKLNKLELLYFSSTLISFSNSS